MAKGIIRKIEIVRANIEHEISSNTDRNNLYSRGLSREGFNGGYLAALDDVMLALYGIVPQRNSWWMKHNRIKKSSAAR